MCQRRNGKTCRDNHRISDGIHDDICILPVCKTRIDSGDEFAAYAGYPIQFHPQFKMFAIPTTREVKFNIH